MNGIFWHVLLHPHVINLMRVIVCQSRATITAQLIILSLYPNCSSSKYGV